MNEQHPSASGSTSATRIKAIVEHGFTERQARFLVLVMRLSGVCVPRQYAQVAGIAQGAKCNAFFERLVRRGHARALECVHNRARLYLVHSRLLYHAIGEPSSRYRRPVAPRLALERLMLLDAVLSTPAEEWLATAVEKAAALPRMSEWTVPDGLPIGVQTDGRIVLLHLALEPWPDAFRASLRAHAPMLQTLPAWTLRIVLPRRFVSAHDAYQTVVREELESPLPIALIDDLQRYFEARKNLLHAAFDAKAEAVFRTGTKTFGASRFEDLYRRWLSHGDEVFASPSSVAITEALERGAGRVESVVLSHSYRHLSPLVGQPRSASDEVEKGVEKRDARGDHAPRRAQPRVSTPSPSRERSVVM